TLPTTISPLSLHDALPIYICYKLRSIIHAYFLRLAVAVHQMVQYPDHPRTFQTVICLNVKDFPVVIINYIKTAELSSVGKNIARSEEHTSELQSREKLVCR